MAVNILLKRSATASKRPVGASMAFGELNLNYDAATGGLYYKNSAGGVVKVGPCQVSATAPNSSPAGSSGNSAGEFWFDSSTQTLKIYDGSAWVEAGGSVQGVTGTAPITVDNTDPLNPVVGVNAASTTAPGAVQLNDTVASTSTTEALTANQGRNLQEQINALAVSSNLTLAGTLDASTGNLVTVTTEGTAAGFTVGNPLPAAAAGNAEFFVIATIGAASYTPPGGSPTEVHVGDWFLSSGTAWNFLDVGFQASYATTATAGIVQLATDAEVQAGVNTDHAVVPSSLQSKLSDSVSTTSSTTIASSTAAKAAYDAGIQGQTDAAAAQADADQALLDAAAAQADADQAILDAAAAQATADQAILDAAAAQSAADNAQTDATQALSDAAAAQVDATQALSDAAGAQTDADQALLDAAAAQATADAAVPDAAYTAAGDLLVGSGAGTYAALPAGAADYILASDGLGGLSWVPQSEGDVTGVTGTAPITVDNTDPQNPIIGVDAASTSAAGVVQLADSVSSTSDTQAATANAVKTAYDAAAAAQGDADQALFDAAAAQATADAALPKAGGTMTGDITFSGAGNGIVFQDASSVEAISNSVATTSSIVAASSTAVKTAYDAALAAQSAAPMASATVLFVNVTTGNNGTAARGTAKPYATITAALAAASEGDTIFVAPGTYAESVTLNKGVNLVGTFVDQAIASGPKISGTFTVSITGAGTRNWAVSNFQLQAASAGNNTVVVSNNSFASGGIGSFTNCFFQQFSSGSLTEQCFATSGTWTRSLYMRNCTFDGNFTHNAGTTAGANGYLVIDALLGIAGSDKYYKVMTGTCEFRNPSNALAPVLHTGGVAVFSNVLSWISNVAATTTIFGGTGFAYKGTSAGLGQAVVYFAGQGCNVVEGSTWGKLSVGSNVIYAFGNVAYDTSLATLSGTPLSAVAPNANAVLSSMTRPQWGYLTASSSVAAANQLGVVLDSSNGNVYTVTAYDAGTF